MTIIWAIGASVRALARSLTASGHQVIAADLFNDLDLQQFALQTQRIVDYPLDLLRLVDQVDADAFIYTGGLENEPELIDQLAQRLPLLGNPGHVLRRVRDPFLLGGTLSRAGFAMPPITTHSLQRAAAGWLRKSAASSGGLRVEWAHSGDTLGPNEYFQAFIEGPVYGASFTSSSNCVDLMGITRQLTDCPWTNARRFHYAGSLAPAQLTDHLRGQIVRLGQYVGDEFGLRGWFGVDLVIDTNQNIHVLEVNPRYTASMELLGEQPAPVVGKAILYAERREIVTHEFSMRLIERGDVADVPSPGSTIAAGSPLCSLFASGTSEQSVLAELHAKSQIVMADFACLPAPEGVQR